MGAHRPQNCSGQKPVSSSPLLQHCPSEGPQPSQSPRRHQLSQASPSTCQALALTGPPSL